MFLGRGPGALACACGNPLIAGYDPAQFLAISIQCERCEAVTGTPPLAAGQAPPYTFGIAEPSADPRTEVTTIPPDGALIGRAEVDRLAALSQPVAPPSNIYHVTAALLDAVEAGYAAAAGAPLPRVPGNDFNGIGQHALGWAVAHLRGRMATGAWTCRESEAAAAASCHVAGFLHFQATWSRHPLFPAMAAAAADGGFALHGLAPFAAAHCLAMQGNRVAFPKPEGDPARINGFSLITPSGGFVGVVTNVFDRFEYPSGQPWNDASLRSAVLETIEASQGRINPRNPGVLLLSPGSALHGFDDALIKAVQAAVQSAGRKQRGLMAVAPIVLRILGTSDPHAVQFGYGLFPVANRHYRGEGMFS